MEMKLIGALSQYQVNIGDCGARSTCAASIKQLRGPCLESLVEVTHKNTLPVRMPKLIIWAGPEGTVEARASYACGVHT